METYLGKIFDQEGRGKGAASEQPTSTGANPKLLEKIQPFTVDKRDMSFKSKVPRDAMEPTKQQKATPIPGTYCQDKLKQDITQSKNYQQFGSTSERVCLIGRDAAVQPFTDPTNTKVPAPDTYQKNETTHKKKQAVLQSVGSSIGAGEQNMTSSFISPIKRDMLDHVSKELKHNPGPGSYDTQIQDKLKTLNFQLSTRYHMKPFGSGTNRFSYQRSPFKESKKNNTIDFNQMISVKDKEIAGKRQAFLETIQMHKAQANMHQNACFASANPRIPLPNSMERAAMAGPSPGGYDYGSDDGLHAKSRIDSSTPHRMPYSLDKTSTKSTFGLTF